MIMIKVHWEFCPNVINHEVITITNRYRTIGGQGLRLSYTESTPQVTKVQALVVQQGDLRPQNAEE